MINISLRKLQKIQERVNMNLNIIKSDISEKRDFRTDRSDDIKLPI